MATEPVLTPADHVRQILNLTVPLTVTLAERNMSIDDLLEMAVGTIVEFEISCDADLILNVSNQPIGKGHAVKVGENFGVRLTGVETVGGRINAMGGP